MNIATRAPSASLGQSRIPHFKPQQRCMATLKPSTRSIELNGSQFTFETGRFAPQADGSSVASLNGDKVMSTAISGPTPRFLLNDSTQPRISFELRQINAASGNIFVPNKFRQWHDTFPSTKEIKESHIGETAVRGLFSPEYINQTQIMSRLLEGREDSDKTALAINGSSLSLLLSSIPWNGPVAAITVGQYKGETILFPNENQSLDVKAVIAVDREGKLLSLQAEGENFSSEHLIGLIQWSQPYLEQLIQAQLELVEELKEKQENEEIIQVNSSVISMASYLAFNRFRELISDYQMSNSDRKEQMRFLRDKTYNSLVQQFPQSPPWILHSAIHRMERIAFRKVILEDNVEGGSARRPDGRLCHEMRDPTVETNLFPSLSGSALFHMGAAQSMTITNLQVASTPNNGFLSFQLRNPPFASNTTGRFERMQKEEIIASDTVTRILSSSISSDRAPKYDIQLYSEALAMDGPSFIQGLNSGTCSLIDAGFPVDRPYTGASCGIIFETTERGDIPGDDKEPNYRILTDLSEVESSFVDAKIYIAGTVENNTSRLSYCRLELSSSQMQKGISLGILEHALIDAQRAQSQIYECIDSVKPSKEVPEAVDLSDPNKKNMDNYDSFKSENNTKKQIQVGSVYTATVLRCQYPLIYLTVPGTSTSIKVHVHNQKFQVGSKVKVRIKRHIIKNIYKGILAK